MRFEVLSCICKEREEPRPSSVFTSDEQVLTIRSPFNARRRSVPVLRETWNGCVGADAVHIQRVAVSLVVLVLHLEVCQLVAVGRKHRAAGISFNSVRSNRAVKTVDRKGLLGAILGNEVDVRSSEIGLGEIRCLALESYPFPIRREIIIRRPSERRIRGLGVLDTGNQVFQGPSRDIARLATGV